jgi:hypothetical protein
MSTGENHIKQYSAEDIQRYINRQMSPAEMHAMEKASHEDPFLAEAMEGYVDNPVDSITSDIAALKKRLSPQAGTKVFPLISTKEKTRRIWWSAAAVILVLLGTSATWYLLSNNTEDSIAQQKEKAVPESPAQVKKAESENKSIHDTDTVKLPAQEPIISDKASSTGKTEQSKPIAPAVVTTESNASAKQDSIAFKVKDKTDDNNTEKELSAATADQADEIVKKQKPAPQERAKVTPPRAGEINRQNKNAEAFLSSNIFKGKVTDEQNKPLPFANLNISNSAVNTYADAHGNFRFMSGDTEALVNVKSIGYESTQVNVQSNIASNNIVLKTDPKHLSEIVVTGYGSQKKKGLTKLEDKKENEVEQEDDRAEPVDGWDYYDIYLYNNKRMPEAQINSAGGYAEISFYVDKHGNLSDFHIDHSACVACDKEAIRLIKQGPRWKLIKGKTPEKVILTIQF